MLYESFLRRFQLVEGISTAEGSVDPQYGWFHDILYPDGKPYRQDEVNVIREILKK